MQTQSFSLTSTDCGDHGGDFERCQLLFQRAGATPVRIDTGFTGWVFVTFDGRYIVTEPLYVLDVREWKQYALFESLQIPNYTKIEAISRDGTRLFISRRDLRDRLQRCPCRILRAHLAVGELSILCDAAVFSNRLAPTEDRPQSAGSDS